MIRNRVIRIINSHKSSFRRHAPFSSSASAFASKPSNQDITLTSYFRTSESDPRKHNERHLGRIYTLPDDFFKKSDPLMVKLASFLPRHFQERTRALGEWTLMIRKPAVEVFNLLDKVDVSKLENPLKIVFYGGPGTGKSCSLAHVKHRAMLEENTVVLDFSNLWKFFHHHEEIVESTYKPGRFDHIVNANVLLRHFSEINKGKLQDVVSSKEYSWSVREKSEVGTPLGEIIQLGIDRTAFAADILSVLLNELRLQADAGKFKLQTIIDGVNALFGEITYVNRDNLIWKNSFYPQMLDKLVPVDDCTVLRALKKHLRAQYKNGVVVCTVDRTKVVDPETRLKITASNPWNQRRKKMVPITQSNYPFALLGEEGWKVMDPFVPVEVPAYSEGEIDVMIDYLVNLGYLRPEASTDTGRQEIKFISGCNPKDFLDYSAVW